MKEERVGLKSVILVGIQFACLFFLMATGPIFYIRSYAIFLELLAVFLALWAILVMQASKLNIFPVPRQGSILIRKGPYRVIRHPMYLAVILFALSLLFMHFNEIRVFAFMVLVIDLIVKIEYEENLLNTDLPGYSEYKMKTYKLIPLLY